MDQLITTALAHHYYLFLKTILFLTALSLFFNLKGIAVLFEKIDKKTWGILALILLAAFALRMGAIPHTHHVYFDEFEHINIAQNMRFTGVFTETAQGSTRLCEVGQFPCWPAGYHAILASLFSVFGDSEQVAFNGSAWIGSFSVIVLFLFIYLLFDDPRTALYSAFLFSLIPVHLKYSGTSEMGITSLFFILASMAAALIYSKLLNLRSLSLLVLLTVYAVYVRPENVLLAAFLPFLIATQTDKRRHSEEKGHSRVIACAGALLCLLIPYFLHIYTNLFVLPAQNWNESLAEHWSHLKNFFPGNLRFWFDYLHPLTYTLLALFGMSQLTKKNIKIPMLYLAWFFAFLLVYSQFATGNMMAHHGSSDRFALNLYVSLIVFAGFGCTELLALIPFKRLTPLLLFGLVAANTFFPLRQVLSETRQEGLYRDYAFILSNKDNLKEDAYVLTYSPPAILSTIHKKAVVPYLFLRMDPLPKELILFKDTLWESRKPDSENIEIILNKIYDFQPISSCETTDGKKLSFIRLKQK